MEIVDFMSGIGGAWVGYHAVRLFGLMCFRMGAAVREWRYQRPAQRALRQADLALDRAELAMDKAWDVDRRTHLLENATHPTARISILEECVEDMEAVMRVLSDPASGAGEFRDAQRAYFEKHGKHDKKKDLPN